MPTLSKVQEEPGATIIPSTVTSLNGEKGAVNIVAGANVTVTPAGQNITVASVPIFDTTYIVGPNGPNFSVYQSGQSAPIYTNADAKTVFNYAIALGGNCDIFVKTTTYNLSGTITGSSINGITLTFENGATLFMNNGVNASAIYLNGCSDWRIENPTINGNASNQSLNGLSYPFYPDGILTINCYDIIVDEAIINNVRVYGVDIIAQGMNTTTNCKVLNSKITNCGWNGISLGGGGGTEITLYADKNEIAFCSDVGISFLGGFLHSVSDNYLHDITGTTGGGGNAGYGIANEGSTYITIKNNRILNASGVGIADTQKGVATNDVISENIVIITSAVVAGQNQPIEVYGNYNIVDGNQINNQLYNIGLFIIGSYNEIMNNIINDIGGGGTAGIYLTNSAGNYASYNKIHDNTVGGTLASVAINISSSSNVSNRIYNNDLYALYHIIQNSSVTTIMFDNAGYNPIGVIANPVSTTGGQTTYIFDINGNSATFVSGTTYTNIESPKTIYILGGTVSAVVVNGKTIATATLAAESITVPLQPGDTFSVTASPMPTINVMGQ